MYKIMGVGTFSCARRDRRIFLIDMYYKCVTVIDPFDKKPNELEAEGKKVYNLFFKVFKILQKERYRKLFQTKLYIMEHGMVCSSKRDASPKRWL